MSMTMQIYLPTFTQKKWPDLVSSPAQYVAANERFEDRLSEELKIEHIQVELTCQNYKEKFHKLICWEEMTHIKTFREK